MAITENETYNFMYLKFDVYRASKILENAPLTTIECNTGWFNFHRIDEAYAMTTDLSLPVFIAQIFIAGEIVSLMIDGNHRHFRAVREGITTIPAKVLSVEQSFEIMSCAFGAEKQLQKFRREARKDGYKIKNQKRKTE